MKTQGHRACGQMGVKFFPLFFLLFAMTSVHAQDYILNGNAQTLGDDCFRLTNATTTQAGSVWFQNKLSLNADFTIEVDLNFGTIDENGADGIAFVLQPLCTDIGSTGEGLGYQNISPSLEVEFDTYYNGNRNDPVPSFDVDEDHIALQKNGNPTHMTPDNLVPPFLTGNIEDGADHPTIITWNTTTQTLVVNFDGNDVISYTGDIVTEIFNGNDRVFWGFTAATGGLFNDQQVCITNISVETIIPYSTTLASCPTASDGAIDLAIPDPGPFTYAWSTGATSEDLDNLTPGNYTVVVTDQALGCSNTYNIEVGSVPDTIAPTVTCPENIDILCSDPTDIAFTGMATATDNCQVILLTVEEVLVNGACADEFSIERRWTAIDQDDNSSSCSQVITKKIDDVPPTCLNCPEDMTITCDEGLPEMPTLQLTDNCDPAPESSVSESSTQTSDGSCTDYSYSLTRTFVLMDRCGNMTEHIQTITVIDEKAPDITCPADITVECVVPSPDTTGMATAIDNCSLNPMITFSDVTLDGMCESECTLERTFRAEDACGNVSTCVQVIVKTGVGLFGDGLTEPIQLGYSFHSLTITEDAEDCIVNWLPGGGGTPTYLPRKRLVVDGTDCDLGSIALTADGQIENPLLVETIILTLNIRLDAELGNRLLYEIETCTLAPILHQFLGSNATVNDLLYLANRGLGNLLGPVPLLAITEAMHCINGLVDLCDQQGSGSMLNGQLQRPIDQDLVTAMKGRALSIYPNPASNVVHLDLAEFAGQSSVLRIYNLQGQLMQQIRVDELPGSAIEISLDQYQNGLYFVAAQIEGFGVKSGEFIVEK